MFWPVVKWSALTAVVTYAAIYSYWRRMPNYQHQRRVNEIQASLGTTDGSSWSWCAGGLCGFASHEHNRWPGQDIPRTKHAILMTWRAVSPNAARGPVAEALTPPLMRPYAVTCAAQRAVRSLT